MLEGEKVRLKRLDKDDLSFYLEFRNNPAYYGQYVDFQRQISETDFMKRLENPSPLLATLQLVEFVIEKKDGTKIGLISHYVIPGYGWMEIGPAIGPTEVGKGYGTEAMQIMVDYLFLTTDIIRITELTDVRNVAAQKCYERVGFKKEGTIRKARYYRGEWADHYIYGILREEWKEPKILTKTS
jgi:RimJ/RimL family protein N-acetyltransferase